MIVSHFIRQKAGESSKRISGVTPEVMDILSSCPWPGNVRELRNVIDYAFVLCPGGDIEKHHLPGKIMSGNISAAVTPVVQPSSGSEKDALLGILRETGWNQSEAARRLSVSRVTVWKRMQKLGIRRPG